MTAEPPDAVGQCERGRGNVGSDQPRDLVAPHYPGYTHDTPDQTAIPGEPGAGKNKAHRGAHETTPVLQNEEKSRAKEAADGSRHHHRGGEVGAIAISLQFQLHDPTRGESRESHQSAEAINGQRTYSE